MFWCVWVVVENTRVWVHTLGEAREYQYLFFHSPITLRQGLSLHLELGWQPGSPSDLLVSASHSTAVSRVHSFHVGALDSNSDP